MNSTGPRTPFTGTVSYADTDVRHLTGMILRYSRICIAFSGMSFCSQQYKKFHTSKHYCTKLQTSCLHLRSLDQLSHQEDYPPNLGNTLLHSSELHILASEHAAKLKPRVACVAVRLHNRLHSLDAGQPFDASL